MKNFHSLGLFSLLFIHNIRWSDATGSCPAEWTHLESSDTCIKAFTDVKSWYQARKACEEENADLVKIQNKAMSDAVGEILTANENTYKYWIGLRDHSEENKFQWLDETTETNFTNWAENEPKSRGDCVCLGYSQHSSTSEYLWEWEDYYCANSKAYICEKFLYKTPKYCPEGWRYMQASGTCIRLYQSRKTWSDARKACHAYGGDLVEILSNEENLFVEGRVDLERGIKGYWIGLHDQDNDGIYLWLNENTALNFTGWYRSRQNGTCAVMGLSNVYYAAWFDINCEREEFFICEIASITTTNCSLGWTEHYNTGTCIKFHNELKTWFDARETCQVKGGYLVIILDSLMNDFIKEEIETRGRELYWIGLHDNNEENQFEWVDNTPVNYSNWFNGQPNNVGQGGGQDCVQIGFVKTYQWNDELCSETAKFICQGQPGEIKSGKKELSVAITTIPDATDFTPVHPPVICLSGWIACNISRTCIKHFEDAETWTNARLACQRDGADLVKVLNIEMNKFVSDNVKMWKTYWIGLHVRKGTFQWLDETTEVNFTNWASGEPYSSGNADCVQLDVKGFTQDWNNVGCHEKIYYICELTSMDAYQMKCPTGWTKMVASGTCIRLSNMMKTWSSARQLCQAEGGDLVKVLNSDINGFVTGNIDANGGGTFWLGLHDGNNDGEFRWLDQSTTAGFVSWHNTVPSSVGTCAIIGQSGYFVWDDVDCEESKNYICEIPPRSSIGCPEDWIELKSTGTCVKLYDKDLNWNDARLSCRSSGADLLKVPSQLINDMIAEMVLSSNSHMYWIGLRDRFKDKKFYWLDETQEVNFTSWADWQPNSYSHSDNCVVYDKYNIGKWKNYECTKKYSYICEYNPSLYTQAPCPVDWEKVHGTGKCIKLGESEKNWTSARLSCQEQGGDLVRIVNTEENRFIAGYIDLYGDIYWLGLHDDNRDQEYSWLDESIVTNFTQWSSYYPLDASLDGGSCVAMGRFGYSLWDNLDCAREEKYVCEVSSDMALNCSTGWIENILSGTCVKLFDSQLSWYSTLSLTEKLQMAGGDRYWIGLHDMYEEDQFEWVDGTLLNFSNWYTNQPNNMGVYDGNTGQDCVLIDSKGDYQWKDDDCRQQNNFVCESGGDAYAFSTTSTGLDISFSEEDSTQMTVTDMSIAATEKTNVATNVPSSSSATISGSKTVESREDIPQEDSAEPNSQPGPLSSIVVAAIVVSAVVVTAALAIVGWRCFRARSTSKSPKSYDVVHFTNQLYVS